MNSKPIHFRQGTWDEDIYNSIVNLNEYQIGKFSSTDVIIDIGCHIGSFSVLAKLNGAGKVYAYEAFRDNYALAVQNTSVFKDVFVYNKAVTRSDIKIEELYFSKCSNQFNTGGGNVFDSDKGFKVETCSLDEIINEIGSEIRLIKFDCEGSEFPILFSSKLLQKVNEIVGEYHNFESLDILPDSLRIKNIEKYNMTILHQYLLRQGFRGRWSPVTENLGKFRYSRINFFNKLRSHANQR